MTPGLKRIRSIRVVFCFSRFVFLLDSSTALVSLDDFSRSVSILLSTKFLSQLFSWISPSRVLLELSMQESFCFSCPSGFCCFNWSPFLSSALVGCSTWFPFLQEDVVLINGIGKEFFVGTISRRRVLVDNIVIVDVSWPEGWQGVDGLISPAIWAPLDSFVTEGACARSCLFSVAWKDRVTAKYPVYASQCLRVRFKCKTTTTRIVALCTH